ncbi:MAG: pyrroline-5-carboxylate reductase [Gammaproteobacteria bacterium]|nr:pyrroline-5-carboxylate reductase [Gammaproteobacteria bacterium]MBU1447702.1 pyrroline-5-carboxylate reductase [Gammaproteobacteria bacterium]MDD2928995.1 pyrroline-5-carboxylate reductase [Sideroxydans sp.]MDD5470627.1 pyrroline-5-carboxylate reductase [Sideroxydans sp.]
MNICFVGGGNMAKALIGGLLKRGYAPSKIRVVESDEERCIDLHTEFVVRATTDISDVIPYSEIILLAVKPQQMQAACRNLAPLLTGQMIISIAAGIRAHDIARWLGTGNIVRAMPNTPALIRHGVSGLYALEAVSGADREKAEAILEAVGTSMWVEKESLLDSVTAISGSGPAYVFYFIEAMQQAAQELGLDDLQSRQLVLDTFIGAAKLADSSQQDIATLRANVTSKNGTTERALVALDANRVKQHIVAAAHAAAARAKEMGDELGKDKDAG